MSKNILYLIFIGICCSTSLKSQDYLDRLKGRWHIDGTAMYEEWKQITDDSLSGEGYSLKDGEKEISEFLSVKRSGSHFVYYAQVPDQNEGRQIAFEAEADRTDCLVFVNMDHDFPKRISYCFAMDSIRVKVSDGAEKEFALLLIRD